MALAVCGLATAVMGGQYPVPRATWAGSSPYYRAPQYRVTGQTVYASPQDAGGQDYAYTGRVYATGYANNAYSGSSCGGCGSCGSGAAGPCGMSYAVPKEPGCCEHSPTCCDHIWDGYCQEKQQRIEHARQFYSRLKSTLRQPFGGCYGYGCGCGRCCGRAVSCQPACGCEAAGMVSEPSMTPAGPAAEPQPVPKAEPKTTPPAPEAKPLKPAPKPKTGAETPAEPGLPLPPAPTESSS